MNKTQPALSLASSTRSLGPAFGEPVPCSLALTRAKIEVNETVQILGATARFLGIGSLGLGIACCISPAYLSVLLPILGGLLIASAGMYYLRSNRNLGDYYTAVWKCLLTTRDLLDREQGISEFSAEIQPVISRIQERLPEVSFLKRYRLNSQLSQLQALQTLANDRIPAMNENCWETDSSSSDSSLEGNSQKVLSNVNLPPENTLSLSSEGDSVSVSSGEVGDDELFGPSFMSQASSLEGRHMMIFSS